MLGNDKMDRRGYVDGGVGQGHNLWLCGKGQIHKTMSTTVKSKPASLTIHLASPRSRLGQCEPCSSLRVVALHLGPQGGVQRDNQRSLGGVGKEHGT